MALPAILKFIPRVVKFIPKAIKATPKVAKSVLNKVKGIPQATKRLLNKVKEIPHLAKEKGKTLLSKAKKNKAALLGVAGTGYLIGDSIYLDNRVDELEQEKQTAENRAQKAEKQVQQVQQMQQTTENKVQTAEEQVRQLQKILAEKENALKESEQARLAAENKAQQAAENKAQQAAEEASQPKTRSETHHIYDDEAYERASARLRGKEYRNVRQKPVFKSDELSQMSANIEALNLPKGKNGQSNTEIYLYKIAQCNRLATDSDTITVDGTQTTFRQYLTGTDGCSFKEMQALLKKGNLTAEEQAKLKASILRIEPLVNNDGKFLKAVHGSRGKMSYAPEGKQNFATETVEVPIKTEEAKTQTSETPAKKEQEATASKLTHALNDATQTPLTMGEALSQDSPIRKAIQGSEY